MTAWIYWQSEPGLWTVGYYKPDGHREPESDHASSDAAAQRVAYLNGGGEVMKLVTALRDIEKTVHTGVMAGTETSSEPVFLGLEEVVNFCHDRAIAALEGR